MKVILISDVKDLGLQGELKEVKNGMARNYLIPHKLAVRATEANLKIWERKKEALEIRKVQILNDTNALAEKLEGLNLTIAMKAGDNDRLYGSVTSQNISDALREKGFGVSRKDIALSNSIKTLGTYNIMIKLFQDISPTIILDVIKLKEETER